MGKHSGGRIGAKRWDFGNSRVEIGNPEGNNTELVVFSSKLFFCCWICWIWLVRLHLILDIVVVHLVTRSRTETLKSLFLEKQFVL